jgi:hypothetical protein
MAVGIYATSPWQPHRGLTPRFSIDKNSPERARDPQGIEEFAGVLHPKVWARS